ncbi:hypothetical protein DVH24_025226 [Malus domestica]|uniref:Uncharacterized protein n=1 Tax=Malus domestica TaxID=3750 RepID=A0A498HQ67_MALDO|nr:hypothetical protein DVH24_025226 [Malus domestica]
MASCWVSSPQPHPNLHPHQSFSKRLLIQSQSRVLSLSNSQRRRRSRICCNYDDETTGRQSQPPIPQGPQPTGIQLYSEIERVLTETVRQAQGRWDGTGDWTQVEGAWVLKPRNSEPKAVVHFIGGIFVGAAPQLTYRLFLERLSEKGILVIATPYASGFDHFFIADETQIKFDRCYRFLKETVCFYFLSSESVCFEFCLIFFLRCTKPEMLDCTGSRSSYFRYWPLFGICHPPFDRYCHFFFLTALKSANLLGFRNSLRWWLNGWLGSRYAVQRNGNVLMAFNNKEASSTIPLFSPVVVPVAQGLGPILAQIASSPTIRLGAEMTLKQFENLSPPIMKQVLPLVEQLPPLYMDLVNGREDFAPKPEETRRLVKSYYGISRNLLVKFRDDMIDETSTLAQLLISNSAISSMLDMSIRLLPGDHGLPLQQALPDVPPAMADAVNRGSEMLANLTVGTPWETVAKEVGSTWGVDSKVLRAEASKDLGLLVDVIASWITSNAGPKLLKP